MSEKKYKLVIVTEGGLCDEPDIQPNENVKTVITKDYKRRIQRMQMEIICRPIKINIISNDR